MSPTRSLRGCAAPVNVPEGLVYRPGTHWRTKVSKDRAPTPTVEAIGKLHFEGNIIPHTFYQRPEFRNESGKIQLLDIMIFADVLYWYRPTYHRDEHTGQVTHVTRKFQGDKLQRSYDELANLFGISKRQATDSVDRMVDRGFLRREFRTVPNGRGIPLANVMFLEPMIEALPVLLSRPEPASGYCYWCAEPPRPNLKKDREEEGAQASAPKTGKGQGGGITKNRDTVSRKIGIPSHEKSGYGIPKNRDTYTETSTEISTERGGVHLSEENARSRTAQPLTAIGNQATCTTLPAEEQKLDAGTPDPADLEDTTTGVASLNNSAALNEEPNILAEVLPPDGGAADAAWDDADLTLFGEGPEASKDAQNTKTADTENVPGGAAAGDKVHERSKTAQEAQEGAEEEPLWEEGGTAPVRPTVAQQEAVTGHDPKQIRTILIRWLGGERKVDMYVSETPPGLARIGRERKDWFNISPARMEQLVQQARAMGGSTWTALIKLLDAELGANVNPAPTRERGGGRQDQARDAGQFDPRLGEGQRCTVKGRLGVVTRVSNAGYMVEFDDGESTSVNRTIAGDLKTLRPSDEPLPEKPGTPAFGVGTRWKRKADGEILVVTEIKPNQDRVLSDGKAVRILDLTTKYEACK